MRSDYEINGVLIHMTDGAAKRWNDGHPGEKDLRTSKVIIEKNGTYRNISLRRAINPDLEPEIAKRIGCHPAKPCKDQASCLS